MEDIQQTTDNTEIQFVSSVAQKNKKRNGKSHHRTRKCD